jgi:hypothetical protein
VGAGVGAGMGAGAGMEVVAGAEDRTSGGADGDKDTGNVSGPEKENDEDDDFWS